MAERPSFEEFRACVLDAYRSLLTTHGFQELPRRPGEFVNEFSVRIGNDTTVIEVEGIHYGMAAWTKVHRRASADTDEYGLPVWQLASQRGARTPKKQRPEDQLAHVRRDAELLLTLAQDVLSGDFAAIDQIVAVNERLEAEREARAPSPEQKAAIIASSEAGHFFKRGDYQKVVDTLRPHLELLSPSQKKRYQIALDRLGGR